jgi:hypothetical protein
MSPQRREADGERQVGPSWESLIERQIREAMDAGKFEDLPHRGASLPRDDDSAAGERALGFRILRDAGFSPPWLETDKEIRALLEQRDRLLARASRTSDLSWPRARRDLRRIVETANRAIRRLEHEAPSPAQQRRLLDLDAELAALERARDADESPSA